MKRLAAQSLAVRAGPRLRATGAGGLSTAGVGGRRAEGTAQFIQHALAALEEIGVHDLNIEVWNALVALAAMPAAHRIQLSTELGRVLRDTAAYRRIKAGAAGPAGPL